MKTNIKLDIYFLQILPSKTLFEHGCTLLLKKYASFDYLSDNLKKFVNNKLKRNNNWCEGVSLHSPSTNNGCEFFNHALKNKYFYGEIVVLTIFLKF